MLRLLHEEGNGFIDRHSLTRGEGLRSRCGRFKDRGDGSASLRAEIKMSMLRTSTHSPTPESEALLDELIRVDRRIKVNEMRAEFDVDVSSLEKSYLNSALAFHSPLSANRHE